MAERGRRCSHVSRTAAARDSSTLRPEMTAVAMCRAGSTTPKEPMEGEEEKKIKMRFNSGEKRDFDYRSLRRPGVRGDGGQR